ncbi:hypothetical protein HU200_016438 [Digitaria exilis]|uniref:Reverse transcriptase domain-containing protein n=1 Tax=Digitaria exilis TaxID=1010633 RepID=A0A835F872_9POAL|nr:hypothetical protein HU200_016438 [Digitaria exilis]
MASSSSSRPPSPSTHDQPSPATTPAPATTKAPPSSLSPTATPFYPSNGRGKHSVGPTTAALQARSPPRQPPIETSSSAPLHHEDLPPCLHLLHLRSLLLDLSGSGSGPESVPAAVRRDDAAGQSSSTASPSDVRSRGEVVPPCAETPREPRPRRPCRSAMRRASSLPGAVDPGVAVGKGSRRVVLLGRGLPRLLLLQPRAASRSRRADASIACRRTTSSGSADCQRAASAAGGYGTSPKTASAPGVQPPPPRKVMVDGVSSVPAGRPPLLPPLPGSQVLFISRDAEMDAEESRLRFALLTASPDARHGLGLEAARVAVLGLPGTADDGLVVRRFAPESFLFVVSSQRLMEAALRVGDFVAGATRFVFRRWTRLIRADAGTLHRRVFLEIEGVPAHAWSWRVARKILDTSCWIESMDAACESKTDMTKMAVTAWCHEPSRIPHTRTLLIAEWEEPVVVGARRRCGESAITSLTRPIPRRVPRPHATSTAARSTTEASLGCRRLFVILGWWMDNPLRALAAHGYSGTNFGNTTAFFSGDAPVVTAGPTHGGGPSVPRPVAAVPHRSNSPDKSETTALGPCFSVEAGLSKANTPGQGSLAPASPEGRASPGPNTPGQCSPLAPILNSNGRATALPPSTINVDIPTGGDSPATAAAIAATSAFLERHGEMYSTRSAPTPKPPKSRGNPYGMPRSGACLCAASLWEIHCNRHGYGGSSTAFLPDEDKVEFLDELRSKWPDSCPWIIAGDFNLLLEASDKNNRNINRRNLGRFRKFVDDMELSYTWSNERLNPTLEKLDRILVSTDWDALFPYSFLQALSSGMSDHAPLHLATNSLPQPKRRFHFESWWIKIPDLTEAISQAWHCPDTITNPYSRLDHLFRKTSRELQSWSQRQVGQIREQLLVARELVLRFDRAMERIDLSADESVRIDLPGIGVEQTDLSHLEVPFTEEEVWNTVKALPKDKSPGPDGFTAEFYRIADYRPISLIHNFAKLVAKVLANRLAPFLHILVDINQSAFIKNRSIHDNFKLVELAAKALHRARKPSLLLKLDISKAFDTVDWCFLLQVLAAMGIILNGEHGNWIANMRGLGQGDPLSPMLFILVMEVLHRLIKAARFCNPMIDKVSAAMPTWRASLMNKAGRLTTVKAVMSATNVHVLISLKIPDWVFKEMDKRRRGFLWAGKEMANGGQCQVAWPVVCRPIEYGGLGIHDLQLAAYSLRLRWLWLKRTDANRPWRDLDLSFGEDPLVAAMFQSSVDIHLGDGFTMRGGH